jgi:hypothetical protein
MDERRLGCAEGLWGSDSEGRGSISVAEKERFRDGERKEWGEREERRCAGDGYEVIGGRRLSSVKDSGCSCAGALEEYAVRSELGSCCCPF